MAEPLLIVDGLHSYYGRAHILEDVALDAGEGEVVVNDTEGRYPIPVPQNRKDNRNNSRTIDDSSKG